jgi:hypothetical protein
MTLGELRSMKNGWLEGRGLAPSECGLDWLADAVTRNYPDDLPQPLFYPTEEGGIRLEWAIEPFDVSLDIDLAKRSASWHSLNVNDDTEDARILDLDDDHCWNWMTGQILTMAGGAA